MRRRSVIATLATLSSGCANLTSQPGTPTDTPTTTATATPDLSLQDVKPAGPGTVERGATVDVTVRNTGTAAGTFEDRLRVVGAETAVPVSVLVPPGETVTGTVRVTAETAGVYEVQLRSESPALVMEPESVAPRLELVTPITGWESYGDARANATSTVTAGERLLLAHRHRYWTIKGVHDVFIQGKVYGPDGDRAGLDRYNDRQLIDDRGWIRWEGILAMDTTGWSPGVYEASVQVRDEVSGATSDALTDTFTVE